MTSHEISFNAAEVQRDEAVREFLEPSPSLRDLSIKQANLQRAQAELTKAAAREGEK
jgi:hypothetical protein